MTSNPGNNPFATRTELQDLGPAQPGQPQSSSTPSLARVPSGFEVPLNPSPYPQASTGQHYFDASNQGVQGERGGGGDIGFEYQWRDESLSKQGDVDEEKAPLTSNAAGGFYPPTSSGPLVPPVHDRLLLIWLTTFV